MRRNKIVCWPGKWILRVLFNKGWGGEEEEKRQRVGNGSQNAAL